MNGVDVVRGHVNGNSVQSAPTAPRPTPDAVAAQDDVYRRGAHMWQHLLTIKDADGRPLHPVFLDLPPREEYPDYYVVITHPMALNIVRDKLTRREYSALVDVFQDLKQVFHNAKRYNASGSGIYMDAKRLLRALKDVYAQLSGTPAEADSDDEPPPLPPPQAGPSTLPALAATAPDPRATAGTSTVNVTPLPSAIPGTSFAKRGPTIKPWLTRKLAETTALTDATGQRYYHTFKQLPDKKVWQQYYQVIARPMSFDQVSNKINKRLYPSVQHFIDDVNLIFTNAQQFNPPGSPIHHASLVMQAHFADVMKEVPPTFIPPRKYNTAKRRAEQEARARGESVADASDGGGGGSKRRRTSRGMSESEPPEDHGSDDDYEEARGSVPPALGSSNPFGLPSPVAMKVEDGMGTAGGSSMSPTGTPGLPPLPSLPNLGGSTFNFGATGGGGAGSSTAPSPLAQMNGISNGSIFHEQQNKPRMIAKAPLNGAAAAPSYISHFIVKTYVDGNLDGPTSTQQFSNSTVRQHSFALPATASRFDITPHFRNGRSGQPLKCTVTASIRPAISASLEPLPDATEGDPAEALHRYAIVPRAKGLTVVEFVVQPRTATDDAREEVYRCFVQKG